MSGRFWVPTRFGPSLGRHTSTNVDDHRPTTANHSGVADAEATFVHYWLKNGGGGENFRREDIVFECFHNFLPLSQWGNMIYNVVAPLEPAHGDPTVKSWFERTMNRNPDEADGSVFTPLDRYVMELFRTISPNGGSLSTLGAVRGVESRDRSIVTPHPPANQDPRQLTNRRSSTGPLQGGSDERYQQRGEEPAGGFARCPFPPAAFAVSDGRWAEVTNSAFGAVYGVVDGTAYPVCDTAGYAPFGFGYRRCAGEQLTTEFIKEFLRTVWKDGIEFVRFDLDHPERIPVSPRTVIDDNIGFQRRK